MENFDVIVIGGGPAGYVAAIKCAQLGFNTACVEENIVDQKVKLGGTCLNVGCIPSKSLLEVSHNYLDVRKHFSTQGININGDIALDLKQVMNYKDKTVKKLTSGVSYLFKENGVTTIVGKGKLVEKNKIEVTNNNGKQEIYTTEKVILATGSTPIEIDSAKFDHKYICDSTDALSFNVIPEKLGIIGAGVIGLELGSVWARFGSKVKIYEAMDKFLPMVDHEIVKITEKEIIKKQNIELSLNSIVNKTEIIGNKVRVNYTKNGEEKYDEFDKIIVAVGRKPNTNNLISENLDIKLDNRGFVEVDSYCQTSFDNVFAIGDIVRGPMLAHKGSEEGIMVAERIVGKKAEVNYNNIPSVIYTYPEIAWTGKTEEQLKKEGIPYKSGLFPFSANGRSLSSNNNAGAVKILADTETDRILGIHISGPQAGEIIAQGVIAMEFSSTAEDINSIVFAHPTLSEVFHEASLAVHKNAIHMPNKKS